MNVTSPANWLRGGMGGHVGGTASIFYISQLLPEH
jgi:hypothetical protein